MPRYTYRLLNVFQVPGDPLSGNPLCVFEDARGLTDEAMQRLALQFNLSETTFILPSADADASVRIFTPTFEMPFAGHPTLGTAAVVSELAGKSDCVRLELSVGTIPVTRSDNSGAGWTLQARRARSRAPSTTRAQLADVLELHEADLAGSALWIDTGSEQLVVPVASADALMRCRPKLADLRRYENVRDSESLVYVFARIGDESVCARFFFQKADSVVEDPATGSGCANLGGYLLTTGTPAPFALEVQQGEVVARPSRLGLRVEASGDIFVSGSVFELGRGYVELP